MNVAELEPWINPPNDVPIHSHSLYPLKTPQIEAAEQSMISMK